MDRIENVTGDDGRSAETVRQRIEAVQQVSTFLNEWTPVVKKCAYGWKCSRGQPFLGSHGRRT